MKVSELIKKLKRFPADSIVGFCCHDNDPETDGLVDGTVGRVAEAPQKVKESCGVGVVLSG